MKMRSLVLLLLLGPFVLIPMSKSNGYCIAAFVAWVLMFVFWKSTSVRTDSMDMSSPRRRLSYPEYDKWAHAMVQQAKGLTSQRFQSDPGIHPADKQAILHCVFGASIHVYAIGWVLLLTIPLNAFLGYLLFVEKPAAYAYTWPVGVLVGGWFGAACGIFYRVMRAASDK